MTENTSKVTLSNTQKFGADGPAYLIALLSALVSLKDCFHEPFLTTLT